MIVLLANSQSWSADTHSKKCYIVMVTQIPKDSPQHHQVTPTKRSPAAAMAPPWPHHHGPTMRRRELRHVTPQRSPSTAPCAAGFPAPATPRRVPAPPPRRPTAAPANAWSRGRGAWGLDPGGWSGGGNATGVAIGFELSFLLCHHFWKLEIKFMCE